MNNPTNCSKKTVPIYILASQTGTILSKIIQRITKETYSHVSISLDSSLEKTYSFGRIFPRNPVYGGFVKESPYHGVFKLFKDTKIKLIRVDVAEETYNKAKKILEEMYQQRKEYGYNYIGLITAFWDKSHPSEKRFYCSEFVRDILVNTDILKPELFREVAKPNDFAELDVGESIFEGYLRDYICLQN